jgi:TP901 family phage tail tape measure protein
MNIGRLEATLGVDTKGLPTAQLAMQNFQKSAQVSMAKIDMSLDKTGRNIYYFGTAATRFLTLPLTLVGAASFKMASDFEFSMQKIVGLVGVGQKQVDGWRKDVMKMGEEFGISSEKMAESLYFITSSGIPAAEAMGVLKDSAKASASGLGDITDFAKTLTSAMNAYAEAGLTSAKSTDILFKAIALGKAEGSDFARQIGDVIPIASKMNIGFDQIAAAMGAITLQGSSAAEASTYLKNAIFKILDPTPDAAKALNTIGISARNLQKIVSEQGLLPAFQALSNATKNYGTEAIAAVLPNIRGFMAYLTLMGDNMEYVEDIFKQVANSTGAADKAWAVMSDTIKTKFNQAWVSVKNSMIEMFMANKDQIIPVITQLAKAVQGLVGWYLNLSSGTRSLINNFLIFTAVLAPLAISVGLVMRSLSGLGAIMKWATPIVKAFWVTMSANPIGAMLVVLGAFATGMLLTSTNTEKAATAQKGFNDELQRGVGLVDEMSSIETLMKVVTTMNARQLNDFRDRISNQIALEEDYTTKVAAELKTRAESALSEQEMQRLLRKQMFENFVLTKEEESQINAKMERDILKQNIEHHLKNTAAYKAYLKNVESLIEISAKNRSKKGSGGLSIEGVEDINKIMKKVADGEKYIALATEVLGVSFDSTSESLQLYKNGLQNLLQIEGISASNSNIQKLVEKLKGVDQNAHFISETMRELDGNLKTNSSMAQLTGNSYKLAEANLSDYTNTLEKFGKKGITSGKEVDQLRAGISLMRREALLSNQELQTSLANIAFQNSFIKESWDTSTIEQQIHNLTSYLKAYTNEVERLQAYKIENPLDDTVNSAFQKAVEHVKSLQKEIDTLNAKQYAIQNLNGAFGNLTGVISNVYAAADLMGESLGGGMEKFASWVGIITSTVQSINGLITFFKALTIATDAHTAATTAQSVAGTVNAGTNAAVATSAVASTTSSVVLTAAQIALAHAYATVAVSGALASSAWIPFPANLAAMTASMTALLTTLGTGTAGANAIVSSGGIPGFAEGGVVPEGFPNDTYLARLSSGETIIPAGKSLSSAAISGSLETTEVEFKISGYDLVAVLNKYSKKLNKA